MSQHEREMQKAVRWMKLRSLTLLATPLFLFFSLLFSEPTVLFGWTEPITEKDAGTDKEYPHRQHDYINIEIDSSLAYAPSLIKAGLIYDFTENKLVWEKNLEEQFPMQKN